MATKRSTGNVAVCSSAASKPEFLTKAQGEQLALQSRQEEIAEQRRRQEQLLSRDLPFESTTNPKPSDSDRRERGKYRDRDRERDRARDRDRAAERRNWERVCEEEARARERARLEKLAERKREKELEAIKEQYLGSKKPKERVIKPSEKFRFSFDSEDTEDTSRDMNSPYQNPHEAQLLFGRGFRAGKDRREQKKLAAKNEKEMRDQIRNKEGVEEKPKEAYAQRRKDAATDLYDTYESRPPLK